MSYTINKTDGTVLTIVPDGQTDNFSTDITFIGKNYSGFGEALNENFVKLLENFSGTSRPLHPIRGQLWYDTTNLKLNIYNGTEFVPVSSASITNSQPLNIGVGDLWYNNIDKQLYFFNGVESVLLGPDYSASQGVSGFKVASILDTLNQTRVVTYLYNSGVLLGIFSKDAFTPKQSIDGFSGDIGIGFTPGTLSGFKINATANNSENLGSLPASRYVRNDTSSIINGQIVLSSDLGLTIGTANQGLFQIQSGNNLVLTNTSSNGKLSLNVRRSVSTEIAVQITSESRKINFYQDFPDSEVNVGGNLVVEGDLTVNGSTTSINVNNLLVKDKTISLGVTDTPADGLVDGSGIVVSGNTDHTLLWSNAGDSWNSSEHVNLAAGREFKIDGVTVLSATSLGSNITSIPGVTSFGKQVSISIGPGAALDPASMVIEGTRISTTEDAISPNLEIAPFNGGNITLVNGPRITGLASPADPQDAVNKSYVDTVIKIRPLVFSMDVSDGISNIEIATLLTQLAPVADYINGTVARILCTTITNSTVSLDINPSVNLTTGTFNTPTGTSDAVTNLTISTTTVSAPTINVTRVIKTFQISGGTWIFIS